MSLSKVLILIMSFLLLLVLVGTFGISVNNSRKFLEEQLAGHAQDTATSLGLSLSESTGSLDIAAAESLVDAVFDRGYYRQIIVRSRDKKNFIERRLPIKVKDVPGWFVTLIPLKTPEGMAQVMSGWQSSGDVLVKSHPGYAYAELWRNFTGILWWFLAAWMAGTLLIIGVMHVLLSHLRDVEDQAIAISNREFPILEKLPWSRELRKVVDAMNIMSKKLKTIFQDQADFIESLRREAYQDPVTGLTNRRHFESRLSFLIDDSDEFIRGALLLIQIEDFKKYNQRYGYKAGDNLLKEMGASIVDVCRKDASEHITARLNGAGFAVLAWGADEGESGKMADKILKELGHLNIKTDSVQPFVFHCGVAGYTGCESVSQLFTKADMALRNAQGSGISGWYRFQDSDSTPENLFTADRLRKLLNRRLNQEDIALSLEPVVSCIDAKLVHYEVLARIKDETGQFLPARQFIKLAEQMNCAHELDKIMVKGVLKHMENQQGSAENFAVNLSPLSLRETQFVDWLIHTLRNVPKYAGSITFESFENPCVMLLESVRPSIDRIIEVGSSFALDHFGVGSTSFGYLINLKLAYLKIDGSYIRRISENKDHQFFVQAISNIAHGLDIRMIACHVERQQDFDAVKMLGVDAVQGKFVTQVSHPKNVKKCGRFWLKLV